MARRRQWRRNAHKVLFAVDPIDAGRSLRTSPIAPPGVNGGDSRPSERLQRTNYIK